MEILYGILLVFAWMAIVVVMRLLTTFLHELGHALPALLFTAAPVEMYVGSYGEAKGTYPLSVGRLRLFFRPRFSAWSLGMCRFEPVDLSGRQQALILLGGPLASVLVAALGLYLIAFRFGASELPFIIGAAFMVSALWDLFVNLVPATVGTSSLHGAAPGLQSDGAQLLALWRSSRLPAIYHEYAQKFKNEDYRPIIEKVEKGLEKGAVEPALLGLAIEAYEATGEYGGALSIYEYLHRRQPLRALDYFRLGDLYQKLSNFQEAINCYGEYLHEYFSDAQALHARGFCHQQLGEHGAAVQEISTALRYNQSLPAAWRDRAYSLIRLNQFEDAASDLEVAKKLQPEHSRQYLYESFLMEATGKYAEAHTALLKAQELGDDFHGIEFKLSELERYL
jgi:Tfp pilus assembly protein PilF